MTSNKDFCHQYAYASNHESKRNGSMSYRNGVMYSYSTALAKKLDNCTLYNSTRYSNTTSKQQSYLRNALHGKIIVLDGMDYGFDFRTSRIVAGLTCCYENAVKNLSKARRTSTKERYHADNLRLQQTLLDLLELKVLAKTDLSDELKALLKGNFDIEKLQKIQKAQKKKEEKARLQELERERQKFQQEVAAFRAGEINHISYGARDLICGGFDIIRLEGQEILTSQNIRVPLKEALKMFKQAKSCKTANASLPIDEIPHEKRSVGKFTIDRIDPSGNCFVGCHKFKFEEIERCYKEEYLKANCPDCGEKVPTMFEHIDKDCLKLKKKK